MNRDLSYIEVAITALEDILSYSADGNGFFPEDDFLENKMLRHAILAHLIMVGKYVGKVSVQTQERFPSNTWKDAKLARNFYVHQYDGIEWPTVYQTVATVLKPTLHLLENVLQNLQNDENNATHQ